MSWVFLDDKFHSNRKILRVGNAGAGVYARSLSYCGDHLTDGFVDEAWVRQACSTSVRDRLVGEGLWVRVEGGFQIPDYLTLNPSREAVLEKRAKRSEAGKKGASKRWGDSNEHGNSHSPSYGKSIAKGLGYNHKGIVCFADIARGWVESPRGWDETFDENAILEEVRRHVRRNVPGWDGRGLDEVEVVSLWKQLRMERYGLEAA